MPESSTKNFSAYITISVNCKLYRKAVSNIQANDEAQVQRFLEALYNTADKKLVKIHRIIQNRK